jgi:hypothetical protein
VYALRTGAVEETSWSDLCANVRARPNNRVKWARPSSPVFNAEKSNGLLDMSRPASLQSSARFLQSAADQAGLVAKLATHNLRRGGAADLSVLKNAPHDKSNDIARSIGHSRASTAKGITDAYMGYNAHDSWSTRVQELTPTTTTSTSAAQTLFGLQTAATPFVRTKVLSRDIDSWCKTKQLDKAVRNNRKAPFQQRSNQG